MKHEYAFEEKEERRSVYVYACVERVNVTVSRTPEKK